MEVGQQILFVALGQMNYDFPLTNSSQKRVEDLFLNWGDPGFLCKAQLCYFLGLDGKDQPFGISSVH